MITLSRMFIHPVKSMRGTSVSHALVQPDGLAGDRRFMLTDINGRFMTARQFPEMVLFDALTIPQGLFIQAPDGSQGVVRFEEFSPANAETEVWGNVFTASIAPEAINHWLSQFFSQPVQLRWTGHDTQRRIKRLPTVPLSFADGYPFLLINQRSFHDLQNRCPAGIRIEQFRPNLVVSGAEAWEEDSWSVLRIGDVTFEVTKPCSRCVLTTVSTERGRRHPGNEPMKTLTGFRQATDDSGDVDFGLNLIARNSGVIRCGDPVSILSRKPARPYRMTPMQSAVPQAEGGGEEIDICWQQTTFRGNTQQILLEQLEGAGISIPYSCRAGSCGCCRMTLVSGEVTALNRAAQNGDTILSCSCIPRSTVVLKPVDD